MKRKTISEAYGVKKSSRGVVESYVTASDAIQPFNISVDDDDVWRLYTHGEWLFAVVNRIVDDCVQVPFEIVPKDKNAKIKGKLKNRIEFCKKFFNDPNGNKESFLEIREKLLRDLLIYGRGAVEKVKDDQGLLREVFSLVAKNIRVRTDKHGNLYKRRTYKLKAANSSSLSTQVVSPSKNKPVYFNKDEVIFVVFLPASKSLYGVKPIDIVANSVASDILRGSYNSNYLVNGAEASGILSLPGLNRTELKRFRQHWQDRFKGANNAHRMFIINSQNLKYQRMSMTSKDMEFIEYGKEIRNKIFAVYSMQPFVMGIVDETTGKLNSAEQVRIYKQGALKPILNKESYYYTKEIIEDGFGFDDIELTFPSIDLEDAKTDVEIDKVDLENGVITINERRRKLGRPTVKWGDTPINTMPGGGQVDANGNLIPPNNQNGNQNNNNSNQNNGDKYYQEEPPTQMELFDRYMCLFKEGYYRDAEKTKEFLNRACLQKLFNKDELFLFKQYMVEMKFLIEYFDGNQDELSEQMDKVLKKYQYSNDYKRLFL